MSLELVTPPQAEPLTLAEAKLHLRVDSTADDDLITGLIKAARLQLEHELRRPLITQTWKLVLDHWPERDPRYKRRGVPEILIPQPPLQQINSIKYLDPDGVQQTLDAALYQVTGTDPGRLTPAYEVSWPTLRQVPGAIAIEFDCGYGDTGESVPANLLAALRLLLAHWYEHREAVSDTPQSELPLGVERLLTFDRNLIA